MQETLVDIAPEGDWFDLYPKTAPSKLELYHPDSVRHPAKMSKPLLRRIIQEMLTCGWLHLGGVLVDPFGGIGATAIEWCALAPENVAVTCELEAPFFQMQALNRVAAEWELQRPLKWKAILGDSRKLHENPACQAYLNAASIGSPPYEESLSGDDPKKRGGLFRDPRRANDRSLTANYNVDPNQLIPTELIQAAMDRWNPENRPAAISSPAYGDVEIFYSSGSIGKGYTEGGKRARDSYTEGRSGQDGAERGAYGRTPGQVGGMSLSDSEFPDPAAISSAPYEAQTGGHGEASRKGMIGETGVMARHAASNSGAKHGSGYAENSAGQIGTMKKEKYSDACRDVYRSLNLLGVRYVALVTKNPVRKQQLKRLDLLTIQLMADAGYVLRARRRAFLWQKVCELEARGVTVERPKEPKSKLDTQYWENWGERPVGNISFFHTVHMAKGRIAPAQWEDVLFFEKGE